MRRFLLITASLAVPAGWLAAEASGPTNWREALGWVQQHTCQTGQSPLPVLLQEPPRVVAEGRVVAYPGAEVVVGTEMAGRIVRLDVREKSAVKQGDVIAELNADDLIAERAEAEARRAEALADLRHANRELDRERRLLDRRVGTEQKVDGLLHDLESARAQVALAEATIRRLDARIAKSRIVAPLDGVVIARHADPGETIDAASPIVTIVDLDRLRIEAEVDELDIPRVALGAEVSISAEGYAQTWPGRVEELPDAVTGRRMRPDDPGRPIDARVLPVKVALPLGTPLRLGQRVDLEITSRTGPSQPETESVGSIATRLPHR